MENQNRGIESSLELVGHRLAVRVDEVETKSEGGIIMYATEKDQQMDLVAKQTGIVTSIGPECWKAYRVLADNGCEVNGRPWVKVGDRVLFSKYASKFIEDPETSEVFALLNDSDVIAKVIDKRIVVKDD